MKNENFITIQGWMINDLKLTSNELLLFAFIYGFSQNRENKFQGSLNYIAETLSISKVTTLNILKKLIKRQLLIKEERIINKVKVVFYKVNLELLKNLTTNKETLPSRLKNLNGGNKKTLPSRLKKLTKGSKETLPNIYNNINIDNNNNNKENYIKEKREINQKEEIKDIPKQDIIDLSFINNEKLRNYIEIWLKYKITKKQPYKSLTQIKILINKIMRECSEDIEEVGKAVEFSIANNYSGLFKSPSNNNNKKEWIF